MKSIVGISYEFDNINKICKDLIKMTQSLRLQKNSVGMLFCSSEVSDLQGLLTLLKELYPFPILGVTTMCSLNNEENIQDVSVNLHVLTADDCKFHIAEVSKVSIENADEAIRTSYKETLSKIDDVPKILFGFPPFKTDVVLDKYPEIFSELVTNVPFFGGVPSQCDLNDSDIRTFLNGTLYDEGFVYMIVEGNINPIFAVGNEVIHTTSTMSTITKSKDNIIYKVDNKTFLEYFEEMNISLRRSETAVDKTAFATSPLVMFKDDPVKGEVQMATRAIKKINPEDGSATVLSSIEQGSRFKLGYITNEDVKNSAEKSMQSIINKIKKAEIDNSNYKYSVIFTVSCVNRYLVMSLKHDLESNVIRNYDKYAISGFYSSGEFAPLVDKGDISNQTYSESIVVCAF